MVVAEGMTESLIQCQSLSGCSRTYYSTEVPNAVRHPIDRATATNLNLFISLLILENHMAGRRR